MQMALVVSVICNKIYILVNTNLYIESMFIIYLPEKRVKLETYEDSFIY